MFADLSKAFNCLSREFNDYVIFYYNGVKCKLNAYVCYQKK